MNPFISQALNDLVRYRAAAAEAGDNPKNWCRCRPMMSPAMVRHLLDYGWCDDDRPWSPICKECSRPQHKPWTLDLAGGSDWVEVKPSPPNSNGHRNGFYE